MSNAASSAIPSSAIPRYSVSELNKAVATLLERGFAPRFLLDATAIKPQLKKGHLWLTLGDGEASISAVVWASQLSKLAFVPEDGDGVVVVGKLNFWANRAALSVQVLDIRASLSGALRQFERVRELLQQEGLLDPERKRPLPLLPNRIALLTSVPSSALADMLRTAKERWPATSLLVVPIPVQGPVGATICRAIELVGNRAKVLGIEALVLARGGGSREDLAVFDGELVARCLALCPIPVVSGLGHEDDTTVADLVADYRAATPTAALVAVLPDRSAALAGIRQLRQYLGQIVALQLSGARKRFQHQLGRLGQLHPLAMLEQHRAKLAHQRQLLAALAPEQVLARGFSLVRDQRGILVRSIGQLNLGDKVQLQLVDGGLVAKVEQIQAASPPFQP